MTFTAKLTDKIPYREGGATSPVKHLPRNIVVGVTHGPVRVEVEEPAGHLRSFWHQLGVLLDEAEHDAEGSE